MAFTADLLAEGQLPATKTTLFTAASPTIIKSITLVNTDSVARTVNLYIKRTTSRHIIPVNLSLAAGACYADDLNRVLGTGDILEGDASSASVIDYVISGASA